MAGPSLNVSTQGVQWPWKDTKLDHFNFIIVLVIVVASGIWILSRAIVSHRTASQQGDSNVPLVPYWIPLVGHALRLAFQPNELLRGTRDASDHGVFAIVLGGSTHNMIYGPSLAQSVFSQRSNVIDFEAIVWWILRKVGGVESKWKSNFDNASEALNAALKKYLLREPELGRITKVTVNNIEMNADRLVSFSRSPVDQFDWERHAAIEVFTKPGSEPEAEVSLLPLILDFIGHQALPSIFGTDFARNNPQILQDLWDFNQGFLLLAAGLPWWLPIPKLSRTYAARRRLELALVELQNQMDATVEEGKEPDEKWDNLQDLSPLLWERHRIYRANGIPPHVRAPGDLALLWAMNANSNFAIFWLLIRILSEPGLVHRLRDELTPWIQVSDPAAAFTKGEAVAPFTIKDKALMSSCPLLRGCFIESMRLDSAPWSVRTALQSFSVTEHEMDVKKGVRPKTFTFEKGSYVSVPFDLHFTDPKYFQSPESFQPERHLHQSKTSEPSDNGDNSTIADWGTVRPFGGGTTMCKGRLFAEREVLTCVAALLTLWDFEPASKDRIWRIPKHGKATGVNMPKEDIRVRLRRRRMQSTELQEG